MKPQACRAQDLCTEYLGDSSGRCAAVMAMSSYPCNLVCLTQQSLLLYIMTESRGSKQQ